MRVIAGRLGGRHFGAPKGHKTHPMSDKMRGAIFSVLGDVEGLSVLDAFAGSGALSLEAISRGAASAIAVDIDKNATEIIKKNLKNLGLESDAKVIRANVSGWSDNNKEAKFDLLLCDPPYDKLQISLLQKLVKHVRTGGIYVVSWPGNLEVPEFINLKKLRTKHYGDSQLIFYKKVL